MTVLAPRHLSSLCVHRHSSRELISQHHQGEMADDADDMYCHLLELPRELRDYIYEEAIVHKAVLEIAPCGDPVEYNDEWRLTDRSWARFRPSEPSLTKTCRQIREEALPMYYGKNKFRTDFNDPRCIKFLKWLTPSKRAMLGHIRIAYNSGDLFRVTGALKPRGCPAKAKDNYEKLRASLRENDVDVPPDALYVSIQSTEDTPVSWTNSPGGKCKREGCCGSATRTPPKLMAPSCEEA